MTAPNLRRLPGRSSGERAFDRILFSFVSFFVLFSLYMLLDWDKIPIHDPVKIAYVAWISFAIGVAGSGLWLWLFWGVVKTWRDPFARVLRVSSILLLVMALPIPLGFLRIPFAAKYGMVRNRF